MREEIISKEASEQIDELQKQVATLKEEIRFHEELNKQYSDKLKKLSSKMEISDRVIYDSQIFKDLGL